MMILLSYPMKFSLLSPLSDFVMSANLLMWHDIYAYKTSRKTRTEIGLKVDCYSTPK